MAYDELSRSAPSRAPDPLDPTGMLTDLATALTSAQTFEAVTDDVVRLATDRIPGADEVSMTLIRDGRPTTIATSGRLALELDERQYEAGWGPCLDAAASGEVFVVHDTTDEPRWPEFVRRAAEAGVRSTLSVPLPMAQETTGGLNIYGMTLDAFDADSVAIARSFAAHAALAVTHAHRYSNVAHQAGQLQEAMRSRAVIEQAKGMLMAIRRCSADEAFEALVRRSQDTQVKLRNVAAEVVREVTGRPD